MDSPSPSSVINTAPSVVSRLSFYLKTWFYKGAISTIFGASTYIIPSVYKKYAPTYTKSYPIRPMLECRVFIPKTYVTGTSLPLYIDIHGGGFFAGTPQMDDKICHYLCNKFNYVVVSIEYRLAPSYPFPIPLDDCIELALAVLNDTDLPVDHDKVAMGGQSAGGSLSLTVSQDARLRSKIKAIVSFYPATDFSNTFVGEYRDKPADSDGKGAEADSLRAIKPLAQWAYPPYGYDLTDPRLSAIYATRESLPSNIYIITARWDVLCQEAFRMACRLAKTDKSDEQGDWDIDGVRWERLPNATHGFIEDGWRSELFGKSDKLWKPEVENVLGKVGLWLEEIFKRS